MVIASITSRISRQSSEWWTIIEEQLKLYQLIRISSRVLTWPTIRLLIRSIILSIIVNAPQQNNYTSRIRGIRNLQKPLGLLKISMILSSVSCTKLQHSFLLILLLGILHGVVFALNWNNIIRKKPFLMCENNYKFSY